MLWRSLTPLPVFPTLQYREDNLKVPMRPDPKSRIDEFFTLQDLGRCGT
jgi:hypothetical protein